MHCNTPIFSDILCARLTNPGEQLLWQNSPQILQPRCWQRANNNTGRRPNVRRELLQHAIAKQARRLILRDSPNQYTSAHESTTTTTLPPPTKTTTAALPTPTSTRTQR